MPTDAMYERERELKRLIAECHHRHQTAFMQETEAWRKELADIALCKPPEPVILPDGRLMTYIGPPPTWTPDGLKMKD
jgi:hypothetical protein